MGVRGWPWWRLLIKITPMLNVHRTEDMLKSKSEELESLRARLEKVSSTTLKMDSILHLLKIILWTFALLSIVTTFPLMAMEMCRDLRKVTWQGILLHEGCSLKNIFENFPWFSFRVGGFVLDSWLAFGFQLYLPKISPKKLWIFTGLLKLIRVSLWQVEKERNDFKAANERLESRLSEVTADLNEEHSAATLARSTH